MKRPILIRPEAEADIEEAYRWYEEKLGGLGADFLEFFMAAATRKNGGPAFSNWVRSTSRRTWK